MERSDGRRSFRFGQVQKRVLFHSLYLGNSSFNSNCGLRQSQKVFPVLVAKSMFNTATQAGPQGASFFRIPVQEDQSKAIIRVSRRKAVAYVQETSIDGYTVTIARKYGDNLRLGRPWILDHEGARVEVHPQWFFNSPDGTLQIGLRRMQDVTPPENVKKSLFSRYRSRVQNDPSISAAIYGGLVLSLITLMALPGVGDALGTAPHIQDAMRWLLNGINQSISQYM